MPEVITANNSSSFAIEQNYQEIPTKFLISVENSHDNFEMSGRITIHLTLRVLTTKVMVGTHNSLNKFAQAAFACFH
jgi:hypothetical protein